MLETREWGVSHNPSNSLLYSFCLSERDSLRCFSDKETSPKLYIYELVIHKLAAVGWQCLQRALPGFAFSNERLTHKGYVCKVQNWEILSLEETSCCWGPSCFVSRRTPWEPGNAASCRSLCPKPSVLLYPIHTLLAPLLLTSDLAGQGGQ